MKNVFFWSNFSKLGILVSLPSSINKTFTSCMRVFYYTFLLKLSIIQQNDAVWYVNDEMKKGTNISYFRKDKLGSGSNGTVYW